MKTFTTLAAAAVLGLGLSAHAGEPLKLDDATLDTITAGAVANNNFVALHQASAGVFPTFALTTLGGQGGFSVQTTTFASKTTTPAGQQVKLSGKASGGASGSGFDFFVGTGGFVALQFGQSGNGNGNGSNDTVL